MSRRLCVGVIGLVLSVVGTPGRAGENAGPNLGGRLAKYREERARAASPEYHLFQRAQYHAWHRDARLEASYNAGISPNRPLRPVVLYPIYPARIHPWVSHYTGP